MGFWDGLVALLTKRFGLSRTVQSRVFWRVAWTSSAWPMVLDVPVEEGSAEGFGVLDEAEAFAELALIFRGFETAF